MLKYFEKLEMTNASSATSSALRGGPSYVQAEVDLVDDRDCPPSRVDGGRDARASRRSATLVPVGFDGEAISAPRVRGVQCALDQRRA